MDPRDTLHVSYQGGVGCGYRGKCQDFPEFTPGTWLSPVRPSVGGRGYADVVCSGLELDEDTASALTFL